MNGLVYYLVSSQTANPDSRKTTMRVGCGEAGESMYKRSNQLLLVSLQLHRFVFTLRFHSLVW